jgi:hypothetical protein
MDVKLQVSGTDAQSKDLEAGFLAQSEILEKDDDFDCEPLVIVEDYSDLSIFGSETSADSVPSFSPQSLADLVGYSQRCISGGEGLDSLQALGLADPDLLAAYSVGFLPASVLEASTKEVAALVTSHGLQDVVLLPAFDDSHRLVDLLIIETQPIGVVRGLSPGNLGLLGNVLTTTPSELVLVNTYQQLVKQWGSGSRNCQLVRGVADVIGNVQRFQHTGIRRLILDFTVKDEELESLKNICGSVSIEVVKMGEVVTTPLELVSYDKITRHAVFQSGDISVTCSVPVLLTAPSKVVIRRGQKFHQDSIDLSVVAKRGRFARSASRTIQIDTTVIERFLEQLLTEVEKLVSPNASTRRFAEKKEDVDFEEVNGLLNNSDLLNRFTQDCANAGWIGDEQVKKLSLLTLSGRRLDKPVWLLLSGESSETLPVLTRLSDLVPTESKLQPAHITKHWFAQNGRDGLDERVLLLDNTDRLPHEFITDLQRYHAQGAIAVSVAARNNATGRMESVVRQVAGSLSVIAVASKTTPLEDMFLRVPLIRSSKQIAQRMDAERSRRKTTKQTNVQSLSVWSAALATIPRLPVAMPWVDRLVFPSSHPQHVHDYEIFCSLVEASALLHYKQRAQIDGSMISTDADVQNAITASAGLLGLDHVGLSEDMSLVLQTLKISSATNEQITIPWLRQQFPAYSSHRLRHAVDELEQLGHVTCTHSGRGRKAGVIQLAAPTSEKSVLISLLPVGQTAPTASEQNSLSFANFANNFANITQAAAMG